MVNTTLCLNKNAPTLHGKLQFRQAQTGFDNFWQISALSVNICLSNFPCPFTVAYFICFYLPMLSSPASQNTTYYKL